MAPCSVNCNTNCSVKGRSRGPDPVGRLGQVAPCEELRAGRAPRPPWRGRRWAPPRGSRFMGPPRCPPRTPLSPTHRSNYTNHHSHTCATKRASRSVGCTAQPPPRSNGRCNPTSKSYSPIRQRPGSPRLCRGVVVPPRHHRSPPPKIGGTRTQIWRPCVPGSGSLGHDNAGPAHAGKCGIAATTAPASPVPRNHRGVWRRGSPPPIRAPKPAADGTPPPKMGRPQSRGVSRCVPQPKRIAPQPAIPYPGHCMGLPGTAPPTGPLP